MLVRQAFPFWFLPEDLLMKSEIFCNATLIKLLYFFSICNLYSSHIGWFTGPSLDMLLLSGLPWIECPSPFHSPLYILWSSEPFHFSPSPDFLWGNLPCSRKSDCRGSCCLWTPSTYSLHHSIGTLLLKSLLCQYFPLLTSFPMHMSIMSLMTLHFS